MEREVRLHINLRHENIIHLFAAFEDEKHVYMVQEFAVCGDLFEDLKKGGGQLKEKYAVRDVIVPFLSALSYLHSQVRAPGFWPGETWRAQGGRGDMCA